jgi:hypothetical protein
VERDESGRRVANEMRLGFQLLNHPVEGGLIKSLEFFDRLR